MPLINQSTEYAIRAATFLAQRHGEDYHLVRDMAEQLAIPAPFLVKILQPLVMQRVLESQRGRGGGYRLARPPAKISLEQIAASQEPLGRARECMLGQAECSDERACPLHEFWKPTSEAFLGKLAQTTLADLVGFCERRPESGYPARSPG